MKFTKNEIIFAVFIIMLFNLLTYLAMKPRSQNYVSSETMVQQTPSAVLTPWLCWITETTANCQATVDNIFRRGQQETFFGRGTIVSWKNPQGSGKAQSWFGCAGTNACGGQFIFSSTSVKVEPNSSGVTVIAGKEDVIPFGSLGIFEVTVENNKFTSIKNRWVGAIAPPILRPGPGISINCVDDNCLIGKL